MGDKVRNIGKEKRLQERKREKQPNRVREKERKKKRLLH